MIHLHRSAGQDWKYVWSNQDAACQATRLQSFYRSRGDVLLFYCLSGSDPTQFPRSTLNKPRIRHLH
jgi:hypothetical protein